MTHQNTVKLPIIAQLTLAQKAAQMVMIDIPDQRLGASTKEHLERYHYNGIILFAKNVDNREQVVALHAELNEALPISPLLTVDQEGGLVDRFRFTGMNLSPGAMGLAATGSEDMTETAHKIMGVELASLGISLDFAPCLDVNSNPSNPIIGVRSFGADPETVSKHGCAAIRGLQSGGTATCGKHFPGHGDTDTDSHIDLPTVTRSRAELEKTELAPFREAIKAGLDSIMTAHVTFPALDPTPGRPATLSKPILTGLLRDDMGFEGVIFTDSMAMQAIADRFGVGEAAVMSVEAGADIVLACGPFENHISTVEAIIEAVSQGRLSEQRLDESLARIYKLKEKYCHSPEEQISYSVEKHLEDMTKICASSVTVLAQEGSESVKLNGPTMILIPDMLPQTPLGEVSRAVSLHEILQQVDPESTVELAEERYHLHGSGDSWREVSARASKYENVIVCLYSRDRLPDGQRLLVENLVRDGNRPIVVSLSSPYLLEGLPNEADKRILTYNYTPLSLEALAKVLLGKAVATGQCPVPQTATT